MKPNLFHYSQGLSDISKLPLFLTFLSFRAQIYAIAQPNSQPNPPVKTSNHGRIYHEETDGQSDRVRQKLMPAGGI